MPMATFQQKATTSVSAGGSGGQAQLAKIPKNFAWDDPDDAFQKGKLSVELISEQGLGKTHVSLTFPGVAMCDTEGKAFIVMRKFMNKHWFRAECLEDVRRFVDACVSDPTIETVVIDSGSDMIDWAEQEYCAEKGAQAVYPVVEYKKVYRKIDEITFGVLDAGKHLVLTARAKDEYIQDTKTGRLIRDSYKKYPYQLQLMIQLEKGIRDSKGTVQYKDFVFGRVVKNGYVGTAFSKPYLIDCSYKGIVAELMQPFFALEDDEQTRVTKIDKMIEEAGTAIRQKPKLIATREGATIKKDVVPGY